MSNIQYFSSRPLPSLLPPSPPSYTPRNEPSPNRTKAISNVPVAQKGEIPNSVEPVLQVTETYITTTTIYSPRRFPDSPVPPIRQTNAVDPKPSISVSEVKAGSRRPPRVDKDLPSLPPSSSDPSNSANASPPSKVQDRSSALLLAQAALGVGYPALGLSFDPSTRQSTSLDIPYSPAPSSTFTTTSTSALLSPNSSTPSASLFVQSPSPTVRDTVTCCGTGAHNCLTRSLIM